MIPSRNIILLPLMLLLSVVTPPGALALKCWQGPLMNRLDVTKQVRAQECAADGTQVSCAADSYTVGGMWCECIYTASEVATRRFLRKTENLVL